MNVGEKIDITMNRERTEQGYWRINEKNGDQNISDHTYNSYKL